MRLEIRCDACGRTKVVHSIMAMHDWSDTHAPGRVCNVRHAEAKVLPVSIEQYEQELDRIIDADEERRLTMMEDR